MATNEVKGGSPIKVGTSIVSASPERSPHATPQQTFKIVIIGETGSGKSSFMNLLLNYSEQFGKEFKLDLVTDLVEHGETKSTNMRSTSSKTERRTIFYNNFTLVVIDTPGFCDTRGSEQDIVNVAGIIDAVKKELYVNTVCLILNGTESRLTAVINEVIKQIVSILPQSVLSNIIVVFTKVRDQLSLEFDIALLEEFQLSIPNTHIFTIDNPYSRKQKLPANPPQSLLEGLSQDFHSAHQVLDKIFEVIRSLKPAVTLKFGEFQEAVQSIKDNLAKIRTHHRNKDKVLKLIENNGSCENPNKKVRYTKIVAKKSNTKNLICTFKDCYQNCHVDCHCFFAFLIPDFCNHCFFAKNTYFSSCNTCSHLSRYHQLTKLRYEEQEVELILPDEGQTETKSLENEVKRHEEQIKDDTRELEKMIATFQNICSITKFSRNAIEQIGNLKEQLETMPGEEFKEKITRMLIKIEEIIPNRTYEHDDYVVIEGHH